MIGGPARVFLALFGFALLSGCAGPPLPVAVPSETPTPDCAETVVTQVGRHAWSLTQATVQDHEFVFENLTKLSFTLTLEADVAIYHGPGPPATIVDWYLADPDRTRVWAHRGSGSIDGSNPPSGTKATVVMGNWNSEELDRVTGKWIVHLDGRSNAVGTIELVGTSTPCAVTAFTETVVEE